MSTTKEWGVKQAAERVARALVALNIPATVMETGVADWPVAVDVLGTKLPMQKNDEWIHRNDPCEFRMQHNQYGHRLRVTRTGQIDTDDLSGGVSTTKPLPSTMWPRNNIPPCWIDTQTLLVLAIVRARSTSVNQLDHTLTPPMGLYSSR